MKVIYTLSSPSMKVVIDPVSLHQYILLPNLPTEIPETCRAVIEKCVDVVIQEDAVKRGRPKSK